MTDRVREVRETFDAIAGAFDETRDEPWEEVRGFVDDRSEGAERRTALDLGCGNGRNLRLLEDRFGTAVGLDVSRGMLRLSGGSVVQGEMTRLPFVDGCADTVLCIAALHHIGSRPERLRALAEIARVLRAASDQGAEDGEALVSVWAIEHPRFDGERDRIRDRGGDVYVPWRRGEEERDRYYHIHERDEFRALVDDSETEGEVWESGGNYYARLSPAD